MKKGCLSEEIFEVFPHEESVRAGHSPIISGDPSREQRARFVRMTKNTLFCRTHYYVGSIYSSQNSIRNLFYGYFCKALFH